MTEEYINMQDEYGNTVLVYARDCHDEAERVDILLQFGANPSVGDPTGSYIRDLMIRYLHNGDPTAALRFLGRIKPSITFLFLQELAVTNRFLTD